MRILGPGQTGAVAQTAAPRRARSGASFRLDDPAETSASQPVAAPASVHGIDALLLLQGEDDAAERRRRTVDRGREALDRLDDLKLALLAGESPGPALARLELAAAGLRSGTDDAGLDAVVGEIQLRAAVELAKHARRR